VALWGAWQLLALARQLRRQTLRWLLRRQTLRWLQTRRLLWGLKLFRVRQRMRRPLWGLKPQVRQVPR
jgi:hypothetical protein